MEALSEGKTIQDLDGIDESLRTGLDNLFSTFPSRTKLAAIMTSHCPVDSRRLALVEELNSIPGVQVDVYGSCGSLKCRERHSTAPWCWKNVLAKNYLFYFSMENTLCNEYITEKLYNPLKHGLVPVVYGGMINAFYLLSIFFYYNTIHDQFEHIFLSV